MPISVTVLVGTTKGTFLLRSKDDRASWQVSGPHCDGWPINHVLADPDTGTIWAAGGGEWQGAGVWRSTDHGQTWALSRLSTGKIDEMLANDPGLAAYMNRTPAPPAPFTGQITALWSLGRAGRTRRIVEGAFGQTLGALGFFYEGARLGAVKLRRQAQA